MDKLARESADVGIFALSLAILIGHDTNEFLTRLSLDSPPKIGTSEIGRRFGRLQEEMRQRVEIEPNKPKTLHIYEAPYLAWAAAHSLGRNFQREVLLKSEYNRLRYPADQLQTAGLALEDYARVFEERMQKMKAASAAEHNEEQFYARKRRISPVRQRLTQYATALLSAIAGLGV